MSCSEACGAAHWRAGDYVTRATEFTFGLTTLLQRHQLSTQQSTEAFPRVSLAVNTNGVKQLREMKTISLRWEWLCQTNEATSQTSRTCRHRHTREQSEQVYIMLAIRGITVKWEQRRRPFTTDWKFLPLLHCTFRQQSRTRASHLDFGANLNLFFIVVTCFALHFWGLPDCSVSLSPARIPVSPAEFQIKTNLWGSKMPASASWLEVAITSTCAICRFGAGGRLRRPACVKELWGLIVFWLHSHSKGVATTLTRWPGSGTEDTSTVNQRVATLIGWTLDEGSFSPVKAFGREVKLLLLELSPFVKNETHSRRSIIKYNETGRRAFYKKRAWWPNVRV